MFAVYNLGSFRRRMFQRSVEIIPVRTLRSEMVMLQIIPDKTVHSGRNVESLLYTFHSMHEGIIERFWNEGFCLMFKAKDHASFRIVYEANRITFYLCVPSSFRSTVVHAVGNVWPKATIRVVADDYTVRLHPETTAGAYLELKDHFFKSTLVDRTRLEPIPSLMAAGRNVMDDDVAILDIAYVPVSDRSWQAKARAARNKYRSGQEPRKLPSKWSDFLFCIGDIIVDGIIEKIFGLIDDIFGTKPEQKQEDFTRAGRELRPATEQKFTHNGFETVIRIASHSKQRSRAEKTLTAIGTAFKDISADNEFEVKRVRQDGRILKPMTRFVQQIQDNRLPVVTLNANILSVPEASQILQLPSAPIQEEYPEIEQLSFREQRLPAALLDGERPGAVPLGNTTGVDPETVHIPGGMTESEKDDRCTPGVMVGGQGSGKTVAGTNQGIYTFGCHLPFEEWKKRGRSVFLYDVTGGKTIRDFIDACPPDRRHRLRVIDYGMSDRRVPLNWALPGMDEEMAADIAGQTIEFIELVTQQSMGPQTHRWLTVHAMAAYEASVDNTPLEVVQSMTDDAFRAEKILPHIRDRAILRDLAVYAAMTPEQRSAITAPILNRYYRLTHAKRLWECVAQRPLRGKDGELLLDYRRFMDGDEEGPYAVLINVPPADDKGRPIPPEVQQAIMLAEASKLWAATLTRNPMDTSLKEYLVLYDEPHQFMKGTPFFKRMFREIRKYRGRPLLLFHEWKAVKDPELAAAILGADPNIHLLKGADANFEKLAPYLSPFTMEEYMAMPKYYAINRIKAAATSYVFMAKLTQPASEVLPTYPVSDDWRKSAEMLSRPKEDVRNDIFDREGNALTPNLLAEADGEIIGEGDALECLRDV